MRQGLGETADQRRLVLVRMQAADVADHPGVQRQAEMGAGVVTANLLGLHGGDIDAVVQGLDALGRPGGQASANLIAHGVGHPEQGQALTEAIGKQLTAKALVVAKPVVHADHRQVSAE